MIATKRLVPLALWVAASSLSAGLATAQVKNPVKDPSVDKPGTAEATVEVKRHPWFEQTEIDLGTFLVDETGTAIFEFKNPNDVDHRMQNFSPSCTCENAIIHVGERRYELANEPKPHSIYRVREVEGKVEREHVEYVTVGAGEEGKIEIHLELRGAAGVKEASLGLTTTDDKARSIRLTTRAIGATFFTLMPNEVNLNKMSWKDKREFTARITSPMQPDFDITGHDELPPKMTVEYRKEMRDGKATWIVTGTYGPNVDPAAGGGIIQFHTNLQDKKIPLRVLAWVEGPLDIKPGGFLPLGMIRHGKGATKEIVITPNDDFDLQVVDLELENLSVPKEFVTVTSRKDGTAIKVQVHVSPDVPRRLIRGDLTVKLNHPAASTQEFQFNGFVR